MAFSTTGGFSSQFLQEQAQHLRFADFDYSDALALGEIALSIAQSRDLPVTIEVWLSERLIFKAALPGTSADNDDWLRRKRNVTEKFKESSMAVRVKYEEQGLDFYSESLLPLHDYAAHGGGWPIILINDSHVGFFGISGLPQVEDHKLIVECLEELHQRSVP